MPKNVNKRGIPYFPALFLKNKNYIYNFKKSGKIVRVVNHKSDKHVKYKFQNNYIISYTKKTKCESEYT